MSEILDHIDIVCSPPPASLSAGGEEGWTSFQFFKKEGLTGPQLLEEGCWERVGWLFPRGAGVNFPTKNKLKYGLFNDRKVYKQEFFALS